MSTIEPNPEDLTPTEDLVLNVLGARYRLGEHGWTFSTRVRPAVRSLRQRGLVNYKSGTVENTLLVFLTTAGVQTAIGETYVPPVAVIHCRDAHGNCGECQLVWPCRTRRMVDSRSDSNFPAL